VSELKDLLKKWTEEPDSVEPEAVAAAILEAAYEKRFVQLARRASVRVISAMLAQVEAAPQKSASGLLLSELVRTTPGADLAERWKSAVDWLERFRSYAAQRRDRRRSEARRLLQNPHLLQAIQTIVVHRSSVYFGREEELLVMDGSPESIEALMPSVVRAQKEGGFVLRRFERQLSASAASAGAKAMLESLRERLKHTDASSPAIEFARVIGLDVERLVISVFFYSEGFRDPDPMVPTARVSSAQGQVHIDSSLSKWVRVFVARSEADFETTDTSFDNEETDDDELKLGSCPPEKLPLWLAKAQRRLRIRWDAQGAGISGSLRGKKRQKLREWLFGPSGLA
jgi:hypothetical protein